MEACKFRNKRHFQIINWKTSIRNNVMETSREIPFNGLVSLMAAEFFRATSIFFVWQWIVWTIDVTLSILFWNLKVFNRFLRSFQRWIFSPGYSPMSVWGCKKKISTSLLKYVWSEIKPFTLHRNGTDDIPFQTFRNWKSFCITK